MSQPAAATPRVSDAARACLDYSAQSQKPRQVAVLHPVKVRRSRLPGGANPHATGQVVREARIYPSGELTVAKRYVGARTRPPTAKRGRRFVRDISQRGKATVQRAIVAKGRQGGCQFVLLTLTSQEARSDDEMRRHLDLFLGWGRKAFPAWFGWYVWRSEDQARGVLHFHVVLSRRLPKGMFRRVRRQWAEVYGMGPGSVDIEKMRTVKGAAKYVSKYLTKDSSGYRLSLDAEGMLGFDSWPVSRHTGEPHKRDRYAGNAYGMSAAARQGTRPIITFTAPWDAFPGLDGWHGTRHFYDDPETAEVVLSASLAVAHADGGDTVGTGPAG